MTPALWYAPDVLFGPLGVNAFAFALIGVFFLVLWWRDREPGLHLIGAAAFVAALFFKLDQLNLLGTPAHYIKPLPGLLFATGIALWALGMSIYLDPKGWQRRGSTWLAAGPQLVLVVLNLIQLPLRRDVATLVHVSACVVMAPVVWRARRAEPGAGHGWVAASMLLVPLTAAWVILSGIDVMYMRYLAIPPSLLFFLTLLVVSLHRRRRGLEREVVRRRRAEQLMAMANSRLVEANASLEDKVQDRTAALHEMVAGLESFNRSISHDLRGPLGGIAGMSRVVAQAVARGDTAKALRQLDLIEKQARQSHELVNALLALAQAEDAPLQRARVATAELVASVVEELQSRQLALGVGIEVQALPDVEADAALLRAVYTNLISNACKFLAGRPHPQVVAGALWQDGEAVYFVRDNGPGFDASVNARLFQPFQRFHGHGFAGHGLGLSIARRAVERHGGRIWAEGRVGQGASFFFTMPPAVARTASSGRAGQLAGVEPGAAGPR